jgi:hypothetical protein
MEGGAAIKSAEHTFHHLYVVRDEVDFVLDFKTWVSCFTQDETSRSLRFRSLGQEDIVVKETYPSRIVLV